MENLVTSLDISKRLDALIKDKKETQFYWHWNDEGLVIDHCWVLVLGRIDNKDIPAYLTDELAEMLPKEVWGFPLTIRFDDDISTVFYSDDRGAFLDKVFVKDKSLPEALGLMVEYLVINHFIKL